MSPESALWSDVRSVFNSLRQRRTSLRSTLGSIKSKDSKHKLNRSSSYTPYEVYQQIMHPTILRDPEATRKLLEIILELPNGRRAVSRLARTCRALSDPALNVLWRDLDSLVPIIGLFPGHLLKRARKPGMGLVSCHPPPDNRL